MRTTRPAPRSADAEPPRSPARASRPAPTGPRAWLGGFLAAFGEREVPMRAVALAYFAFFTLFPLALLAVALLGFLVRAHAPLAEQLRSSAIDAVASALNGSGGSAASAVTGALTALRDNAPAIGVVGVLGLIWGLSGSLSAIAAAISRIFDPKAPLPGLVQRLKSGIVIFAVGALFAALTLTGIVLPLVADLLPFGGLIVTLYAFVSKLLAPVLTFALFYRYLPTRPPVPRAALIGGLVGGLLYSLLQFGFSYYLRFVSFNSAFGPLASVAVLFVWLNFSALTFLVGALVAARLRPEDAESATDAERAKHPSVA